MPVQLDVNQRQLADLARALKDEADGKELKKELGANIRAAVEPGVAAVRRSVMALAGVPTKAKTQVAAKVKVTIRYTGQSTGVKVAVPRNAAPGFLNAAKAFNEAGGWRAPNWGNRGWHDQRSSSPNFWDPDLQARADEIERAFLAAVEAMAQRIARR